jgi:hypothetical protein
MCKAMIDLKNILAFRFTYWLSTSPKERLPVGVFYDSRLFRKIIFPFAEPIGYAKDGVSGWRTGRLHPDRPP